MNKEAVEISECPLCQGNKLERHIRVKDWRGSNEEFQLLECQDCHFILTSPRPLDADLGKYYPSEDYVSHTNKAKSLFDKVYFEVQKRNLADKQKKIQSFKGSGRLLDYGCGAGSFIAHMQNAKWTVEGVELSDQAAKIASERTGVSVKSPKAYYSDNEAFDVITLWHVLEHLPDLVGRLEVFKLWLKPNGYLFLALPNHRSLDAKVYGDRWAAWDVPIHLWHFNRSSIGQLAKKFGLEWVDTLPMPFDAYYVSMISAKNQSKLAWPVHGLWSGWKSNRQAKRTNEASSLIYVLKKPK